MSGCARGWWSWRERSRASAIGGCRCCCGEAENRSTTSEYFVYIERRD